MTTKGAYVTADDLLNSRRSWLAVTVVDTGRGYDVALKIDGTYTHRTDAEEVAELFRRDLRHVLANLDPTRFLEALGPRP